MSVPHPFADLYARIPEMKCAGHCGRDRWNTCCGPIACTEIEANFLEEYDGVRSAWSINADGTVRMDLKAAGGMICPHLGLGGRCTAYEVRPLICRAWGTVRALACPWGCRPERWMADREFAEILSEMRSRTNL